MPCGKRGAVVSLTANENLLPATGDFSLSEISGSPKRGKSRDVLVMICVSVIAALLIVRYGSTPIEEIPALTPSLGAVILTTDFASGFLLFVIFYEARQLSLLLLGCAYLYAGSTAALNLITFPGMLHRDAIILGTSQSAAWAILEFWMGYGLLGLSAVAVECFSQVRTVDKPKTRQIILIGTMSMLVLISGIFVVTIRFTQMLPPLMRGSTFTNTVWTARSISICMMLITLGLGLVAGRRNRIFLWFCLAVTALLCVNILTLTGGGRNTLGWVLGRASWALSSSVLFLYFIGQFASQLRFLARAKETLEAQVRKRTIDLTQTLRQRDLLLREVYHRVKNNMQVVDSILFLESRRISDQPTKDMVEILRKRVFALGLVHQQLMASESMEHFGIAPFIRELVENLAISEAAQQRGIRLEALVDEIDVDLDFAIPLGLLITELVTNSFKHANALSIFVSFHLVNQNLAKLTVEDDGAEVETIATKGADRALSSGAGSKIVDGFIRQLDGQLETTRDKGMRTTISMPLPERVLI